MKKIKGILNDHVRALIAQKDLYNEERQKNFRGQQKSSKNKEGKKIDRKIVHKGDILITIDKLIKFPGRPSLRKIARSLGIDKKTLKNRMERYKIKLT